MDWALAIERNRQPLLRIVAVLFSMIGLGEGSFVARVSRPVYRAVLWCCARQKRRCGG